MKKKKFEQSQSDLILADDPAELLVTKPEDFKALVEKNMPEFVAKINSKEDLGNTVLSTSQEFLLVIEDVLRRKFDFTEDDFKKLHNEIKPILKGVTEFEKDGLNLTSLHDIEMIGDMIEGTSIGGLLTEIALSRAQKERLNRAGIDTPTLPGATPFIKKMLKGK